MQKIYGFSSQTRMLYFGAILLMVIAGLSLIVLGFCATGSRHHRERSNALGCVVMGVIAIMGAAAPYQGWRKGGRSRVIVTEDALVYEEDGHPREIPWSDIDDLSEMATYIQIGLRDKGGSITIPNAFENFPDLVQEIRNRGRIRTPW